MGKGDQRTRRGKVHRGTFGKSRPKRKNMEKSAPAAAPRAKKRG